MERAWHRTTAIDLNKVQWNGGKVNYSVLPGLRTAPLVHRGGGYRSEIRMRMVQCRVDLGVVLSSTARFVILCML